MSNVGVVGVQWGDEGKEQDVILNKLMQECEQIWMAHVETEAGGGNQSSPGGVE